MQNDNLYLGKRICINYGICRFWGNLECIFLVVLVMNNIKYWDYAFIFKEYEDKISLTWVKLILP